MENTQTISSILSGSKSIKDRILGRQLKNPNYDKMRVYRRKLYEVFLRSIDQESRDSLVKQDLIINSINGYYSRNGGWYITDAGIYSADSQKIQVTNADGELEEVYTFEMPRTEEGYVTHDYVPNSLSLSVVRHTEERFLEEHADELAAIHQAFIAKRDILDNGKYAPKSPEYEEIVRAIEKFMGYNQPKEEIVKK